MNAARHNDDQLKTLELLEKDASSFPVSLKGLSPEKILGCYNQKIGELERKLEDEKLEYWRARAREEFLGEADSEVYLGKIEQPIDKLRVEQQSLSAKKPVVASSTSPASPPSIKSPALSKPAFSTSKPLDRKKLTLKQAAEYLGIAVQTV